MCGKPLQWNLKLTNRLARLVKFTANQPVI